MQFERGILTINKANRTMKVKHIVNHVAFADRGKFSLSIDVRPLPRTECAIVTSIRNENYDSNAALDLLFCLIIRNDFTD